MFGCLFDERIDSEIAVKRLVGLYIADWPGQTRTSSLTAYKRAVGSLHDTRSDVVVSIVSTRRSPLCIKCKRISKQFCHFLMSWFSSTRE